MFWSFLKTRLGRKGKIGAVYRRPLTKEVPMSVPFGPGIASTFQGQVLRRSERREVAIFLRDQALWVADFVDGRGALFDAVTWFRFNCGDLANPKARRRMVLESAIPPTAGLAARIGALLRECGGLPRDYSAAGAPNAPSPAEPITAQHRHVVRCNVYQSKEDP
jgi:hypothetical protein